MGYINNAKIIKFKDLPKVGEFKNGKVCIEVKITDFKIYEEFTTKNYIIYQVVWCEVGSLHLLDDFFCDCIICSYAIKIEDLGKEV